MRIDDIAMGLSLEYPLTHGFIREYSEEMTRLFYLGEGPGKVAEVVGKWQKIRDSYRDDRLIKGIRQ